MPKISPVNASTQYHMVIGSKAYEERGRAELSAEAYVPPINTVPGGGQMGNF